MQLEEDMYCIGLEQIRENIHFKELLIPIQFAMYFLCGHFRVAEVAFVTVTSKIKLRR